MAEDLDNLSEQFNEKEPRAAAFKALFNVLQTSTYDTLSGEGFSKGFPTYPEEFIFEANTIKTALSEVDIVPSRTRTWVTGSLGSTSLEKLITGEFSTSISSDISSNPYVEKIICPLTKVQGTKDQFYFVFGKENITSEEYSNFYESAEDAGEGYSGKETAAGFLFDSQSAILKNFINPFKFGKGYNFKLYSSLNPEGSSTAYETFGPSQTTLAGGSPVANQTSGLIFDYREGGLFVASQPTNNEDPNLSNLIHPLWIEAYRYYGPVGISGPQHTITASNIQVDNNLNVDGAISLKGFSFASVDSFTTSGSSTFGDDVDLDTHEFTGSVSITGSLFATASHALTASFATNAGQSGITSIMISSSLHDEVNGDYDITTLTPTDGEDIIEYKPTGIGFLLSSSIGSSSYITLIGSKSAALITKPKRTGPGYPNSSQIKSIGVGNSINDMPSNVGWNGGDIFQYTHQDKDYPDFSSYGAFNHTESLTDGKKYTTQSFSFPTPTKIDKIGLWYSRGSNVDPRQDFNITDILVDPYVGNFDPVSNYIDEIQLSGSTDGTTWVGLLEKTNMNAERTGSNPIISSSIIYTNDSRWPNSIPSIDNGIGMVHFTSSKLNAPEYQYYKLHAHGGAANLGVEGYLYQYIHHLDIYQDKNFSENNRKQINIGFDHNKQDGEFFTNFQLAVSSAAAVLGFEGYTLPENQAVVGGIAKRDVDMNDHDLLNVEDLDADSITTNTLTVNGNSFFSDQNSILQNQNILEQQNNIYMGFNPSGFSSFPSQSIVLKELNPIYFTNQKQNGDLGVDQFSAKIFGHYTNEGVSDLYLDAFRIYKVADKEIRFTTLHPEGITVISSSQTLITSSVTIKGPLDVHGEIRQNGILFSGGGGGGAGSGFPHNQLSTEITASITGSLTISGSEGHLPFIEFGNINQGSNTPLQNLRSLYVMNETLYFGNNPLGSTDPDATSGTFTGNFSGPLTGNVTGDLTGTASRADSSSVAISSSYALSSSYAVSASFSTTSSYAITSSYAVSASFATTSSYAVSASYAVSSSHAENSNFTISSSHAATASHLITHDLHIPGTLSTVNHVNLDTTINNIADELHWHLYNSNTTISSSKSILVKGDASINNKLSVYGLIQAYNDLTVGYYGAQTESIHIQGLGGEAVDAIAEINLTHGSNDWGTIIRSQNGGNTATFSNPYGLNFISKNNNTLTSSLFLDRGNSRVGIGTEYPWEQLHVPKGNIQIGAFNSANMEGSEGDHSLKIHTLGGEGVNNKSAIELFHGDQSWGFSINSLDGYSGFTGLDFKYHNGNVSGQTALFINRFNGNIGIGIPVPGERLTVNGDARVYGDITAHSDLRAYGDIIIGIEGDGIDNTYLKSDNGNLIVAGDAYNGDTSIEIRNTDTADEAKINTVSLKFGLKGDSPAGKIVAGKDSFYTTNNSFFDSNLQFYTTTNNVDTEKMRILSNGLVSIGDSPNPVVPSTPSNGTFNLWAYNAIGTRDDLVAQKNISASGHLFASTSNAGTNLYQTVLVDTASGKFYYTGSYGGGNGGTVINYEGTDDDWLVESTNLITSSRNIKIDVHNPAISMFRNVPSTTTGDSLGSIKWANVDRGEIHPTAYIRANATQNHDASDLGGTELNFFTTEDNNPSADKTLTLRPDASTISSNFHLPDGKAIRLGNDGDLQLYHDPQHHRSYITNLYGELVISNLYDGGPGSAFKEKIKFQVRGSNGTVEDYYYLDGQFDRNYFAKKIHLGDNTKVEIGGGEDLQLYHNDYGSYIDQTGTGGLRIRNTVLNEDIRFYARSNMASEGVREVFRITEDKLQITSARLREHSANFELYNNKNKGTYNDGTILSTINFTGRISASNQTIGFEDENAVWSEQKLYLADIRAITQDHNARLFNSGQADQYLLLDDTPTKLEFRTSATDGILNGYSASLDPTFGFINQGYLQSDIKDITNQGSTYYQIVWRDHDQTFYRGETYTPNQGNQGGTLSGRNISTKTLTGESTNPIVNTNQNQYQPVRVRKGGTDYDLETSITLQGSGIVNLLVSAMISVGNIHSYNTMQTQIQYSTTNGNSWTTKTSNIPGYSTTDNKDTLLSFCSISSFPIDIGSNLSVGDVIKVRIQLRNLSNESYYINRTESGGITGISYLTVEEVGSVSSTTI